MSEPHFHRYPNERNTSTAQFSGIGITKWCAICGTHKPQTGGLTKIIMGGRHWVCVLHNKKPVNEHQ